MTSQSSRPLNFAAMADWSALPDIAVTLIARRFELIEDFIAFRQTCTSWRAATTLKDFDRSCPRLPLLMLDPPNGIDRKYFDLPNGIDRKYVDERTFFSLSKRKICKVSLPEAREAAHCLGSKGWLIMVDYNNDMCLLHPITRVRIPLPNHPQPCHYFESPVLSASPSETSEYVLMIVFRTQVSNILESLCSMAIWKPGDVTWTRIEVEESIYFVGHLCYYNDKFYALAPRSQVLVYDVLGPNPNKATKIMDLPWDYTLSAQFVECGGRLLVIVSDDKEDEDGEPYVDLEIFELDVIKGSYTKITSLGNSAVFLGSEGFLIDAIKFPGLIEPNYIYWSNGRYMSADVPPPPAMPLYDIYISPALLSGFWVSDGVWINF